MKHTLSCLAVAMFLGACSTPGVNSDEPIRNQKLTTNFTEDGIKVETDCVWYKFWKTRCDVTAIESTAVTWTNGGTNVQMREAVKVAQDMAGANMARFLNTSVNETRITTTIAKHIEKARDTQDTKSDMTDTEAKRTSLSNRENSNDTARTVTTSIQSNATAILKGFRVIKTDRVGQQEVAVTIRWDQESASVRNQIERLMR